MRAQIARERGVSAQNAFGLLAEIGAECAGAVVIVPEGQGLAPADTSSVRWLSEDALAHALADLPAHPLGGGTDVRLSLGGVQDKLVVTRAPSGRFGQPLGGAPSTHIIKPSIAGWADIAANEAFCLRLARCCGLSAASSEVAQIGEVACLIVERFDRTFTDGTRILRLHQEDFCQALGVLPEAKYEAKGGPSVGMIVAALREISLPCTTSCRRRSRGHDEDSHARRGWGGARRDHARCLAAAGSGLRRERAPPPTRGAPARGAREGVCRGDLGDRARRGCGGIEGGRWPHDPAILGARALLAQSVEHLHGKEGVNGSSPLEGS